MELHKFEGVDIKYGNTFEKFQPKNTQIRNFFLKFTKCHFLHQSLELEKFEVVDFKYENIFSLNSRPKLPIIGIFCRKYNYFPCCMKLPILKNSSVLIPKMTMISPSSSLKISQYNISCEKSKFLSVYLKLCVNLVFPNWIWLIISKCCCYIRVLCIS